MFTRTAPSGVGEGLGGVSDLDAEDETVGDRLAAADGFDADVTGGLDGGGDGDTAPPPPHATVSSRANPSGTARRDIEARC
jgi:hypothetical protein